MGTPCIDPSHAPRLSPYIPTEYQAWSKRTVKRFGGWGSHAPDPPPPPPVGHRPSVEHPSAWKSLQARTAAAFREAPSRRAQTQDELALKAREDKLLAKQFGSQEGSVPTSSGPGVRAQVWRLRSKGNELSATVRASQAFLEREKISADHLHTPRAVNPLVHTEPRSSRTARWATRDPLGAALLSCWGDWTPRAGHAVAPVLGEGEWWHEGPPSARRGTWMDSDSEGAGLLNLTGSTPPLMPPQQRIEVRDAKGRLVQKPDVPSRYATSITVSHAASRAIVAAVLDVPAPAWPPPLRRHSVNLNAHTRIPKHWPVTREPSTPRAAPVRPISARPVLERSRSPRVEQPASADAPARYHHRQPRTRPPSAPPQHRQPPSPASRPAPPRPASAHATVNRGGSDKKKP